MNKLLLILNISFVAALLLTSSCKKSSVTANSDDALIPSVPVLISNSDPNLSADTSSKTAFLYDQTNNTNYTTHDYQGCPAIGIYGNTYFAAWQTGGKGEQPGNYITVAV